MRCSRCTAAHLRCPQCPSLANDSAAAQPWAPGGALGICCEVSLEVSLIRSQNCMASPVPASAPLWTAAAHKVCCLLDCKLITVPSSGMGSLQVRCVLGREGGGTSTCFHRREWLSHAFSRAEPDWGACT